MKTPVERLAGKIRERFPDAAVELDRPASDGGIWWMDVGLGDARLTIEWRPDAGFGVSARGEAVYGESSDEHFDTEKAAFDRIKSLLLSGATTSAPPELTLAELRRSVGMSQVALAELLAINQASVSRAERRSDYLVGTLRAIIEALGGRLHLVAEFPDRTVELQFPDVEDDAPARSEAGAVEC
jgi:DNA-binding transcriptional regulator YiaG